MAKWDAVGRVFWVGWLMLDNWPVLLDSRSSLQYRLYYHTSFEPMFKLQVSKILRIKRSVLDQKDGVSDILSTSFATCLPIKMPMRRASLPYGLPIGVESKSCSCFRMCSWDMSYSLEILRESMSDYYNFESRPNKATLSFSHSYLTPSEPYALQKQPFQLV